MVVGNTIEHLRNRPKEERRAVARSIAISVAIVLFCVWIVFFFENLDLGPLPTNSKEIQNVAASAANAFRAEATPGE